MYFITGFYKIESKENSWPEFGAQRTFGYYFERVDAIAALHENWSDIYDNTYDYAVIENIEEGVHPLETYRQWFKWDDERKGYFEIDEPECVKYLCNFALG